MSRNLKKTETSCVFWKVTRWVTFLVTVVLSQRYGRYFDYQRNQIQIQYVIRYKIRKYEMTIYRIVGTGMSIRKMRRALKVQILILVRFLAK